METREILKRVRKGTLSVEEAEGYFRRKPIEDFGFARLDTHRETRSGFPEVVYCAGKADEYLSIFQALYEENGEVLGTRASAEPARLIQAILPQAEYDPLSRILKIERPGKRRTGCVCVCTAGTADIPVGEAAARTAEFFGCHVERLYDVGVSGLRRLLSRLESVQSANCVIAAAGMEGALASVIGGLVSRPVIAVPTPIGCGANFGGLSALLTMVNSCVNGVAVVNIDNGYGVEYLAAQINRLAQRQEVA